MQAIAQSRPITKRAILLRDGATFAVLCAVTAALFGLTLLLFHGFAHRRDELGAQWSAKGQAALKAGQPKEAVDAFRTALTFSPNDSDDQLALAQALAASGHIDEATNYFRDLWESRPGEGFLNVELARLARQKGDTQDAETYYRAAIVGNWQGDGVQRRRETRLELADYLESQGNAAGARKELLIAAGNAPAREGLEVAFGDRLNAMGDTADALAYYRKAIQDDPVRQTALERAGHAAYALGKYKEAAELFDRIVTRAKKHNDTARLAAMTPLLENSRRMVELNLSPEQSAGERADHLLAARAVAQKRMQACSAEMAKDHADTTPTSIASLQNRWASAQKADGRDALVADRALEDSLTTLILDTERVTANYCGQPAGDDALLLALTGTPSVK